MKQAIILAAGRGSRLDPASDGMPKCLVRVGGVSLLEWQLQMLESVGVDRVAIVVGYRQEQVRAIVGDRCEYIVNSRYSTTNSLYSLWLARTWVDGPFVLINGDVFAHPHIYQRLTSVDGCALTYDGSSGDDEEHMKVTMQGDLVQALGKDLPASTIDGENVGLLQFDTSGAMLLFQEADRLIDTGGEGSWAPAAVDQVVKRMGFRGIDIAGLPWTEIDYPQDVQTAEHEVLPVIRRDLLTMPECDTDANGDALAGDSSIALSNGSIRQTRGQR